MSGYGWMIYSTHLAQAASAVVLALLLAAFSIHYHRNYLRHWAWSWASLAIYLTSSAIALAIGDDYIATHPIRLTLSALSSIAAYVSIACLLFGCWEIVRRRSVPLRVERAVLISVVALGIVTTLAFVTSADPELRFLARTGIRGLLAGIAFLIAAAQLLSPRIRAGRVGFLIVAICFVLYGVQQLHYFVISVLFLFDFTVSYAQYLGHADLLIQSCIGLGMVTSLLEDEREAVTHAASEIEHLAYHDSLTGLPNRTLFLDRLILACAHATRHRKNLSVLFLDLDRFKDINDSLGHSSGDQLLKSVAQRVQQSIRAEDTLARFGGDEFTILLASIESPEDAVTVANKLIQMLRIPFMIGDGELFVTSSIGVSVFPHDGVDAESLIRAADTAMYRAKEDGRDRAQLHAPAMNAAAIERLALEQTLRRALQQEEFVLHFQPLIGVKSRRVEALEALIRWQHPELGLLLPAQFITIAEMSGLIVPIGDWVLRSACKQLRSFSRILGEDIAVAVNLSPRQFHQQDLVESVTRALEESGIAPNQLEVEITESSAMQNADNSVRTLRELKRLGVHIAMDDFGTGYSSLSYLKRFPIDSLKLDRSFVRDLPADVDDSAIASAVLAMAKSLSLTVTAEGVETQEQLDFLVERGCERVQGYFFSKPLSAEHLAVYLEANRHTVRN